MKRINGFSLIIAIFIVLFFSLLSIIAASLFSTDIQIAIDTLHSVQVFFLAESGMNYCIKHQLVNDPNWSNNSDIKNIPLGPGVFDIEYLTRTETTANIQFTGRVGNITRRIMRDFQNIIWPEKQDDFPYCYYVGEIYKARNPDSIEYLGPGVDRVNYNPNLKMIDLEWDPIYYIDEAKKLGQYSKKLKLLNKVNETLSGIFFAEQYVEILRCDNLTINGTIATEGYIYIDECTNLRITPPVPYPGLIAKIGGITINLNNNDIVIKGGIFMFSQSDEIVIKNNNKVQLSGLLYSENNISINDIEESFTSLGSIISWGDTDINDSGIVKILRSDNILNRPPGIYWDLSIRMGLWKETY